MDFCNLSNSNRTMKTNNKKVVALETSIKECVINFQDLVLDLQQLHIDSENFRLQYLTDKEKCENKTCMAAEELKKIITTKDHIIQSVASSLTKVNETKDLSILAETFKILFGEGEPLTPPTDDVSSKIQPSDDINKAVSPIDKHSIADSSIPENVSNKEESLCEIESTPTGRTSPIIQTKKTRSILAKTEVRDKKKCPNDWHTPESKVIKLIFPSPSSRSTPKGSGKLRQSRLNLITVKTPTVVDLTCSPEVMAQKQDAPVQPLIKKESVEEDTILPSPTSGPTNLTLFKTISKASPSKFKKPKPKALSLKSRCDDVRQNENKDTSNSTNTDMDVSINILNQFSNRMRDMKKENTVHNRSPVKMEKCSPIKKEKHTPVKKEIESVNMKVQLEEDDDATHASTFLQDIEQIEDRRDLHSPLKCPLVENINIANTPPKQDAESSMSILRPDTNTAAVETVKRKLPELVEPIYKESVVRKKTEKQNLQGWSCEECMNFYGVLYKDDPVMLAKKIQDCSKHRGRHNPARPKTPPNFWNPRWTVPEDTEELNRMNNAN